MVEPNISKHSEFRLTDYKTAVEMSDIIVFLVAHNEFKLIKISKEKKVIDFCGVQLKK